MRLFLFLAAVGCKSTPSGPATEVPIDADGDGFSAEQDCDDADADVNPDASEVCDGVDNNCSGEVDEGLDTQDYFMDEDDDGFGGGAPIASCEAVPGRVLDDSDCDDAAAEVHPDAPEVCDGIDNNCSGSVDEGLPTFEAFLDADGDGFGDPNDVADVCVLPAGRSLDGTDCDDAAAGVHPDAVEVCDAVDQDCNGLVDDGLPTNDYRPDADQDGFGDAGAAPTPACSAPPGMVLDALDCDDTDADVSPNGVEVCDEVDNDCDGDVDEGLQSVFIVDADADGSGVEVMACSEPAGVADVDLGDCDDADPARYPGAAELCDGIDSDCGGDDEVLVASGGSIQAGIDAAFPGDCVCIEAGTFPANLTLDKSLHIEGRGPMGTVIDGGSLGRVLNVGANVDSWSLTGVTLTNGQAGRGAGLRIEGPDTLTTLTDVGIDGNACVTSPCEGAGARLRGQVTATRVSVSDNTADVPDDGNLVGVGLHIEGGVFNASQLTIEDNIGTCVGSIWVDGGGMYATGADISIDDGSISFNALNGGQTRAPSLGAYGGTIDLDRVEIRGNQAVGDTYPYSAKGAVQLGSSGVFRNVLLAENTATVQSGGTILGSAMTLFHGTQLVMEHSTVAYNTAPSAWAVFDGNGTSSVTFDHVILADNDGNALGRGSDTTYTLDYTLVDDSGFVNSAWISGGTGNIEGHAGFVDAAAGDFTLSGASQAVDAGDPTLFDTDGSVTDLGAYSGPNPLP